MKLTQSQLKQHEAAIELLKKDELTEEDKEFVINHWQPRAHAKTKYSAFYTPTDLVHSVAIEANVQQPKDVHILDLAAGIGSLAFAVSRVIGSDRSRKVHLTCVELDATSIAVGKKVLPEAEWIEMDLSYSHQFAELPKADLFVSNPPFGSLPRNMVGGNTAQHLWEYYIAQMGMTRCWYGVMIVPANVLPWRLSGKQTFEEVANPRYEKWSQATGLRLSPNCGIDTTIGEQFLATNITVEIACVERITDE